MTVIYHIVDEHLRLIARFEVIGNIFFLRGLYETLICLETFSMVLILTQLPRVIHLVFSNASFGSSPMFFSSSVSPPPSHSASFCSCVERERGGKNKLERRKTSQVSACN